MAMLKETPWIYETSQEFGESILIFSGAEGKLYFANELTGQKLEVKYSYFSVGVSKGAVLNIAESLKSDPSEGFGKVQVRSGSDFGPASFPCSGWMVFAGGTAGIFQPSFMSHSGLTLCYAIFGGIPFGGVPFWGRFNSIMPSAGASAAFCQFSL